MRVGVPKEIKDHEDRVGLVPSSVAELVHHGHAVLIERGAGLGAGLGDDQYVAAGAKIVDTAEDVFAQSEMIVARSCSPTCIWRRIAPRPRT
jgi:alanine dehydrogenase